MHAKVLGSLVATVLLWGTACSPSPGKVKLSYRVYTEKGRTYPPGVEVYSGGKKISVLSNKPAEHSKRHDSGTINRRGNQLLSKESLELRWMSPCGLRKSPLEFDDPQLKSREKEILKRPEGATMIGVSVKEKKPQHWPSKDPVYFFVDYGDGARPVKVGQRQLRKPEKKIADAVYGVRCAKRHAVRIGDQAVGSLDDSKAKYVFIGQPGKCYLLHEKLYTTYNLSAPAPKKLAGGKVHVLKEFVDYFLEEAPKRIRVRKGNSFEKRYSLTKSPCGS